MATDIRSVAPGGFAAGRGGNTQTLNHPTAGRVPGGAIVERKAPTPAPGGQLRLQLRQADFTTAARVAEAINRKFGSGPAAPAQAEGPSLVKVTAPPAFEGKPVEFMATIENLTVEADRRARIVVNERTGTIVLGKEVRVAGTVTDVFSVYRVGYFQVDDGSGRIAVVTTQISPRQGQRVEARGVVEQAYTMGDKQMVVVVEKAHREDGSSAAK